MAREIVYPYVEGQHEDLIRKMEELSGNKRDPDRLSELIGNSRRSVSAWERICGYLAVKELPPTLLFDAISFLITSRCRPETAELYTLMEDELKGSPDADRTRLALFWLGYPLWCHKDRYLSELLKDFRISGSNYITWWSLDYSGDTAMQQLFSAYNYSQIK